MTMGCYGIGVSRIVGRGHRAESRRQRHPLAGAHAPFDVILIEINPKKSEPVTAAAAMSVQGSAGRGPRAGLRVLAREEDLARQLVRSLDARQSALAIITTNAPDDIITGTNRNLTALSPLGISAAKLNTVQMAVFRELLELYVRGFLGGTGGDGIAED